MCASLQLSGGDVPSRVTSASKLGKSGARPTARFGSIYNRRAMDTGLKGRVAVVAASSQGIGRATAEAFAAEGCRLAMCSRNPETLKAAATSIQKQHNTEVFSQAFDVTDAGAVRDFVAATVSRFGSADICVTNAGGPPAKGFLAASIEDWRKAVDANFL